MLTEEQYHTKRKTWIAHIQLLTGDLHLKGKMSNVYNKKFTIFHSHPDKGKMTHLLQIYGKNKRKMYWQLLSNQQLKSPKKKIVYNTMNNLKKYL